MFVLINQWFNKQPVAKKNSEIENPNIQTDIIPTSERPIAVRISDNDYQDAVKWLLDNDILSWKLTDVMLQETDDCKDAMYYCILCLDRCLNRGGGKWEYRTFYFENKEDAMRFKMVWYCQYDMRY